MAKRRAVINVGRKSAKNYIGTKEVLLLLQMCNCVNERQKFIAIIF